MFTQPHAQARRDARSKTKSGASGVRARSATVQFNGEGDGLVRRFPVQVTTCYARNSPETIGDQRSVAIRRGSGGFSHDMVLGAGALRTVCLRHGHSNPMIDHRNGLVGRKCQSGPRHLAVDRYILVVEDVEIEAVTAGLEEGASAIKHEGRDELTPDGGANGITGPRSVTERSDG